MSDWTPQAHHAEHDPEQVAAREAQHQVLIELLAAYADRELPPETTAQIEAHLVGCARCRRELAVHHALRRRLAAEPAVGASGALRDRIAAAVAETPVPARATRAAAWSRRWILAAAVALLAVAAAVVAMRRGADDRPALARVERTASVPLLAGVLDDYRRVTAGELPGRARDLAAVRAAVPFDVEPVHADGVRLVAAWTTMVGIEPAAVLAYRADDQVLLQYLVADAAFFADRTLREAVRGGRVLVAQDGALGVAAWPTRAAASVVVGELPAARIPALLGRGRLAGRVTRGAE